MNSKIIELRLTVRALPTSNEQIQNAVKAEVLRLADELNKVLIRQSEVEFEDNWQDTLTSPTPKELQVMEQSARELEMDFIGEQP